MALTKITTSVVAVNSLTAANIADNSIDATKIANNQILARHIAAGSLTDQLGTLPSATISGNLVVDTTTLVVDSSNNRVGIGTTSPDALLDIQSDSNPTIRLTDNKVWNSGDSGIHGTLEWFTTDASTNAARVLSYIKSENDAGSAVPNGYLTFATARGGGNVEVAQERMRIDSSGNVGIGTNSPTKSLSVKAPSGSNGGIDVFHNNGNKVAELVHHGSGDEGRLNLYDGGTSTVQLHGETGQNSYINSGNVGIGTTTPGSNSSKANNLVVGSGSAGGMAVFNGTAEGWYAFSRANADNTDAYDGGMSYTDRVLRFHTNAGATRLKIDGSGDTEIYGHLGLEDNKLLMFGGGQDARLYFDASTNALMITASNGTANTVNITTNNFQIGGATPLISGTANDSVVINQDGASNVDFRVESDNQQHNFFCDASSEIIHFGEGTNSDTQEVIPAGTLAGRRHGYHGGNRTHAGQTFKYCEGTSWTDAIKIDWNNPSWGGVCMRITGMYYYNASNNFSIVIGFAGHAATTSVSYDATSNGVLNWTSALELAQTATGETMIRQRAGDSTGDVVYRYEWQTYNRSDQTILIVEQ